MSRAAERGHGVTTAGAVTADAALAPRAGERGREVMVTLAQDSFIQQEATYQVRGGAQRPSTMMISTSTTGTQETGSGT